MSAKVIVLALPGTGHPNGGDGVTEDFLVQFDPSRYETRIVSYAAAFGGRDMSFADSRATGRTAMLASLESLPKGTPVVLAGYSQGAVIVGDVAAEFAATPRYNIKAVALIADGYRPRGVGVVPPGNAMAEGYGIAGERSVPADRFPTFWVSAWGDPISSLPAGNPLRVVADIAQWFSIRSVHDVYRWGAAVFDLAIRGRNQQWWNPVYWGRWNSAIGFARGFLVEEKHTRDYIRYRYTAALAKAVAHAVES